MVRGEGVETDAVEGAVVRGVWSTGRGGAAPEWAWSEGGAATEWVWLSASGENIVQSWSGVPEVNKSEMKIRTFCSGNQ